VTTTPTPPTHLATTPATRPATAAELRAPLAAFVRFWLSFTALNVLLFLPAALLNRGDSSLLPSIHSARELLGWRENLDPFRLSAELTLLTAVWLFLPGLRASRWARPFRGLIAATFLLALLYTIYETLSLSFYASDPIFYAQARLVAEELPFLLQSLRLPAGMVLAGAGGLVLLGLLVGWLLRGLWAPLPGPAGRAARLLLALLLIIVLGAGLRYGRALAAPRSAVSCLTCKLVQNGRASADLAQRVRQTGSLPVSAVYEYGGYELLARPDIYLIFVESYGSILYQEPALREPYLALLDELQGELAAGGWQSTTILSESPTWGGGSWMAYTSALFGLRIDSHPAYLALRDRFAGGGYPGLGHALQELGYQYAHTTPIAAELPAEEQAVAETFFGVDRWLTYEDLAYEGAHYGWGPAPPDQFALGRADELLRATGDQPLLFFMLTQNSHYPWAEVPPLAADFHDLNQPGEAPPARDLGVRQVKVTPEQYLTAIGYELRFLTQFVREQAAEDALIILVGDHQPGYISRRADGFATPIHVLSKDGALTAVLEQYGFSPGLALPNLTPGMKHEGFYSLLMRVLVQRYGRGDQLPPPYLPDGLAAADPLHSPTTQSSSRPR